MTVPLKRKLAAGREVEAMFDLRWRYKASSISGTLMESAVELDGLLPARTLSQGLIAPP